MVEIVLLLGFIFLAVLLLRSSKKTSASSDLAETADEFLEANQSKPSLGEKDAWEGWFSDGDSPRIFSRSVRLIYVDGEKNQTERDVDITKFDPDYEGVGLAIGHCHLRNATRTFRFDRISQLLDLESGELVTSKIRRYMMSEYEKTPEFSAERLTKEFFDQIRVLLFMAKADGQIRSAERDVIASYASEITQDSRVGRSQVDPVLDELEIPTLHAFKLAVGRISKLDLFDTSRFLEINEAIVSTQKNSSAMEKEALEYLKMKLALSK